MGEIKPTSFRVSTVATEKFKELSNQLGMTQAEFMDNLLNAFELENAKSKILDRSKEIEEFQSHAQRLISIYLNSLELNQNSEERIKQKFLEQLQSKAELINNLQDQLQSLKDKIKESDMLVKDSIEKQTELKKANEQLQDTATAKESLISEYKEKIDTLSSLVNEYKEYKDSITTVNLELNKTKKEANDLQYTIKNLELEKVNLDKQIKMLENNLLDQKEMLKKEKEDINIRITDVKNEYTQNIKREKADLEQIFNEKLGIEKEKFEIELAKIELKKNTEIQELRKQLSALEKSPKPKKTSTKKIQNQKKK